MSDEAIIVAVAPVEAEPEAVETVEPEAVAEAEAAAVEAVADSAVEIAQIEADRDIIIAEIEASTTEAIIEATAEAAPPSELETCQQNIASLELQLAEMKDQQSLILSRLPPAPNPEPSPEPESVEATPELVEAELAVPSEPEKRRRGLRFI